MKRTNIMKQEAPPRRWAIWLGLALLLMLIGSSQSVWAQTFVAGQVVDANGNPVAGATVLVRGNGVFTLTDTDFNGRWQFSALPTGTYEFYAASSLYGDWPEPRYLSTSAGSNILLTLGSPTNNIAGGDFESNYASVYWQQPNGGLVYTSDSFDGRTAARLGEGVANQVDCWQNGQQGRLWTLKQPVTVPNINAPGVSFVYKINTSQVVFDYAWFEVVLLVNGEPFYLSPWGQIWQNRNWTVASYDLSTWRGQTVDLLFQVAHCGSQNFTATVDRVTLGSMPGAPNPGVNPWPGPGGPSDPISTPVPGTPTSYSIEQVRGELNGAITQIRGSVVDRFGNPVNGARVQVRSGTFCTVSVPSGTPGVYPQGEYDVLLREYASYGEWQVSLVDRPTDPQNNTCDPSAQQLSPEVRVTTTTDQGVVYVDFRGN